MDDIREGIEELKEVLKGSEGEKAREEVKEKKAKGRGGKGEESVEVKEKGDYSELYEILVSMKDKLKKVREKLKSGKKFFKP